MQSFVPLRGKMGGWNNEWLDGKIDSMVTNGLLGFLEKYKQFFTGDEIRESVIDFFGARGVPLTKKDITLRNGILLIDTNPVAKSTIFLNREMLLKNLREKFGAKAPMEIR